MPQALPLTTKISQSSTRKRTNRVLSAQFGDGYSQEAPDGINNQIDEWSLVFDNLDSTDRNTLWTALNAVGGYDYFTWTPAGDSAKKWKVKGDISETPLSGNLYSVSFTLKQFF